MPDADRQYLRQLQKQRRDEEGYVKATVILLLDKGRPASSIADDLGLDDATIYRYAHAWQQLGLEKYLLHQARGYWGLLCSAGLAALSRELEQTLYTDMRAVGGWVRRYWGVDYSVSGLTQLLHRLGFSYKLTTPAPCEADPARQVAFLAEQLQPLLEKAEAGQAVVYFRRRGPSDPHYALNSGLDPHRAAQATIYRQRPGAGEPERGAQRPLPHAGAPTRNRLRERAKHESLG